MIISVRIFVLAGVISLSACATAVPAEADPDDYLIHITRSWSEASALGDLRFSMLGADDLEFRFWAGYGLSGTRGLVLRRVAGEWEAYAAEVASCDLLLPPDFVITDQNKPELREKARSECGKIQDRSEGKLFSFDTVAVRSIPAPNDIAETCSDLKQLGVESLPGRLIRRYEMLDGHTYVMELRSGDRYSVSVIEHWEPARVQADQTIQAIARLLTTRFEVPLTPDRM